MQVYYKERATRVSDVGWCTCMKHVYSVLALPYSVTLEGIILSALLLGVGS